MKGQVDRVFFCATIKKIVYNNLCVTFAHAQALSAREAN